MQQKAVKTSDSHPILVNFIDFGWGQQRARLGITFAPGKKQPNGWAGCWDRDLKKDLRRIKQEYNISTLVCLLEKKEFINLKIENELEECENLGIKAYNFPIVDNSIPEKQEEFKILVRQIVQSHLKQGKNVVVHCMGGLGRAPTFAASCLIYSGLKATDAIQLVKKARENTLTESRQLGFLKQLAF